MTNGLFDGLMDETVTEQPTTEPTEAADSNESSTVEETRETVQVSSLDELPEGYVDVRKFAWELTKANLAKAQEDGREPNADDMVDTQAVYAATRNKRWSLPSLDAVGPDGAKLGVVIPLAEGLTAWENRPERGTGTGGSAMTPERRATRILRAGKALDRQAYWDARVKRYGELLEQVGATWDDAKAAFEAWAESEEGKKAIKDDKDSDNE